MPCEPFCKVVFRGVGSRDYEIKAGVNSLCFWISEVGQSFPPEVCSTLAKHPSSQVRAQVAMLGNLDEKALSILEKSTNIEVRTSLIENAEFQRHVGFETLREYVRADRENAISIAENFLNFTAVEDISDLEDLLVSHPEPSVRFALLRAGHGSKRVVRALRSDNDPEVAEMARQLDSRQRRRRVA